MNSYGNLFYMIYNAFSLKSDVLNLAPANMITVPFLRVGISTGVGRIVSHHTLVSFI